MRYRKLGNSDLECSVVGIGTWGLSGQGWESSRVSDDDQSIAAIRAAVDAGINFIDTALTYGSGHAEELVGEAIDGIRDKVIVATKCVSDRIAPNPDVVRDWRPAALRRQLEKLQENKPQKNKMVFSTELNEQCMQYLKTGKADVEKLKAITRQNQSQQLQRITSSLWVARADLAENNRREAQSILEQIVKLAPNLYPGKVAAEMLAALPAKEKDAE